MKSLVIVESPAKAKTINKFLGSDFVVKASVGHVRDLPSKKMGIDVDNGFVPEYVVIEGKEKILKELKTQAKKADAIYLCPDPDREGEAIAWHVSEAIGGKARDRIYRVTFNEITKRAVLDAMEHPTRINMDLVEAQQARRILDRLVGYRLSPLLWRKVRRGLSAGRVQSVAVKLVVDREREIEAFVPEEYWTVTGRFEGSALPAFTAKLSKYKGKKVKIANEEEVRRIMADLDGAAFRLQRIERKERKRNPVPPFITSKLQQEAFRKLGFPAKKTMRLAQNLYEGIELGNEGSVGLITYMRTDSVRVANEARTEARGFVKKEFGADYVPKKPPVYRSKKGAQEGHEAIRPTTVLRTPASLKSALNRDQFRLYDLIWKRFVASQMAPALLDQTGFDIVGGDYLFRATGTVVRFPGFMSVYQEGTDDRSRREDTGDEAVDTLPSLTEGEDIKSRGIEPKQHFTQPPPRFTEATLVKELEERGIGRPSTYAAILSTIQDRKYVEKSEGKFRPTELGVVVNDLLVAHFTDLIDFGFTAKMEENLDAVEAGRLSWRDVVDQFYRPFEAALEKATTIARVKPEDRPTDQVCEECGKPLVERWGRHGRFLACTGFPDCRHTRPLSGEGTAAAIEQTDEKCPTCASPMVLRTGRYGKFLACSAYPDCKTTKPLGTGVACPEDGGEIVERRGKSGKTFYSCNNYPKCKFALWNRPLPRACPSCGYPFVVERRDRQGNVTISCGKKGCGFKESVLPETKTDQPGPPKTNPG